SLILFNCCALMGVSLMYVLKRFLDMRRSQSKLNTLSESFTQFFMEARISESSNSVNLSICWEEPNKFSRFTLFTKKCCKAGVANSLRVCEMYFARFKA